MAKTTTVEEEQMSCNQLTASSDHTRIAIRFHPELGRAGRGRPARHGQCRGGRQTTGSF